VRQYWPGVLQLPGQCETEREFVMADEFEHLLVCETARTHVVDSQHDVTDLDPGTLSRAPPSHLPMPTHHRHCPS